MSTFASATLAGLVATLQTTTATEAAESGKAMAGGVSIETLGVWIVLGLVVALIAFAMYDS